MLERELDKLELKSRAIHQVWKDLPVGPNSNWEDDVMGAQAKELMEEHDELMSRRGRLQDLLKQAAGIAPARLEQAIPDTEDGSTEPKKPSGVAFLLRHESCEAARIIKNNGRSQRPSSDADSTDHMHTLLNLALRL